MHDWWPDTWEKLPASAPPPSPRRRRTLRRRGLPTSGGCAQLHLRKNQLLSAQLRNLHSFSTVWTKPGTCRCTTTATATTPTANSAVFCTVCIMHLSSTTTGMSTTTKNCTCRRAKLRNLHSFLLCLSKHLSLHNNEHVNDFVPS